MNEGKTGASIIGAGIWAYHAGFVFVGGDVNGLMRLRMPGPV